MPISEPRWVARVVVDAIQTDMLLTHGGMRGLRDENLLESALARPKRLRSYTPGVDIAAFADWVRLHTVRRGQESG